MTAVVDAHAVSNAAGMIRDRGFIQLRFRETVVRKENRCCIAHTASQRPGNIRVQGDNNTMQETAAVQATIEGEALTIRANGLVTLNAMRAIRNEVFRALVTAEVRRVLIDASRSTLLMGPESWNRLASELVSEHAIKVPLALLVADPAAELAWAFCDRLNKHGRTAMVFTSAPDAYWWVSGRQERRSGPRMPPAMPEPPTT